MRAGTTLEASVSEFVASYGIQEDIAARDLETTWREWQETVFAPLPAVAVPDPPRLPATPHQSSFTRDYHLHGKILRVILHDASLIDEIVPRLEPLLFSSVSRPAATLQALAMEGVYYIFSGGSCVATEEHPTAARVVFLQELVRHTQANPSWSAILHAGACGTENRCVLFPAASHSGKTTLAAVLMKAGLTFYGDDSVPLQAESLTIPVMPFSLMIREDSWPEVAARFPQLWDAPVHCRYGEKVRFLHPTIIFGNSQGRAAAIVFSQWRVGASTTLTSLNHFDALVRLQDSGLWVAHDQDNIRAFLSWVRALPIYEMFYSDVDEATACIKKLLDS